MNEQIDYRAVRQRVKSGVERQKQLTNWFLFGMNIFMFVLFTLMAYGIYLSGDGNSLSEIFRSSNGIENENPELGALVLLHVGWFVSLIFHGVSLYLDTKMGERQIRNRVIASELGRELFQLGMDDDPLEKRKRLVELGDDGELEDVEDEEDIELAARFNQHMNSSSSG